MYHNWAYCDKTKKKTQTILSSFTEVTTDFMLKTISPLWQGTEEVSQQNDHITPVKPEQLNHHLPEQGRDCKNTNR